MSIDQFFSEFNVNAGRQTAFSVELRMRVERLLLEQQKLSAYCAQQDALQKAKDEEIEKLRSEVLSSKDESTKVVRLRSALKSSESAHATEVSSLKE